MNILVPDNWLREHLQTKATPVELKKCLSLCGPSIERIHKNGTDVVYDIEVTTNRPDAMSVVGIAREAAAILPRFGIAAKLLDDPYAKETKQFVQSHKKEGEKKLSITTDHTLNPRWTSIVLTNVRVGLSPAWLKEKLEATGIRSINTVIDITNYVMRAYGQPAHAFDYDSIGAKNGVPTMELRASKKGEKIITLDGKTHTLPGNDIVIVDGQDRLIDLCGIMGGQNSSIKNTTTTVVLFMQTYNPVNIRKTSMALAHRTEAASLFEKGLDSELVLPTLTRGVELMEELTGAKVASKLYDIYPHPYKPHSAIVTKQKNEAYLGTHLTDSDIEKMLIPLGFVPHITKQDITLVVPSWRHDVKLDVDIIEEIARIYGYHNIATRLPEGEPPIVLPDPQLFWEQEIKTRLRDWGFVELYAYSMISEKLMDIFHLDKTKSYKITNPLSEEWVYMRPTLLPSVLETVSKNTKIAHDLSLFELSMIYRYRPGQLPEERPMLTIAVTGNKFRELKGFAEGLFTILGIPFSEVGTGKEPFEWYTQTHLNLGDYGVVGEVKSELVQKLGTNVAVTVLDLDVIKLVEHATTTKKFIPIPKYPPIIEDLSFIVPENFSVGPLMDALAKAHALVQSVRLLDAFENKRTVRVTYCDPARTLTNIDVAPIRQKLIELAEEKFGISTIV